MSLVASSPVQPGVGVGAGAAFAVAFGINFVMNIMAGKAQGEAGVAGARANAEIQQMSIKSQKKFRKRAKQVFDPYYQYGKGQLGKVEKAARDVYDLDTDSETQGVLRLAKRSFNGDAAQLAKLKEEVYVGQEGEAFNRTLQGAKLGLGITKGLGQTEQAYGSALSKAFMSTGQGYISALQNAAKSRQETIGRGVSIAGQGLAAWEYGKERRRLRDDFPQSDVTPWASTEAY